MEKPTKPDARSRPGRRKAALIAALVAGESAAVWLALYGLPGTPEPEVAPSLTTEVSGPSGSKLTVHQQILNDFITADPAKKPGLVSAGPQITPLMKAYYAGRDPDEISAASFQPADSAPARTNRGFSVWMAQRDRGQGPVVAAFRRTAEGRWTMDWPIYAQTYDCAFRNFVGRPEAGEAEFRVLLTRLGDTAAASLRVKLIDPWDQGSCAETLESDVAPAAAHEIVSALRPGAFAPATIRLTWQKTTHPRKFHPVVSSLVSWGYHGYDSPETSDLNLPVQAAATVSPQ